MKNMATACVVWCGLVLLTTASADETVAPVEKAATTEREAWAAGMEAMSVAMPPMLSSADTSVDPAPAGSNPRGNFLAVPIPRVDPALGNGLVGAAAYIFKLDRKDNESPPSVVGAGGMWMDSGSWGAGLGSKLYLGQDRYRLMAGLAFADLRYDLVAGSDDMGSKKSLPLSQEAYGGVAHAQFRVAPDSYLGIRVQIGKLGTTLRGDDIPNVPVPIENDIGKVVSVNSLGPSFAFDTRDSAYYPRSGLALDAGIDIYFGAIGSEVSFDHYELNYRQYLTVRESDVLAWQAYMCAADGDPPFFLQCQVGPNSLLRGYSFGEHRGDAMAATQVEYRWQVHRRWILAAFAGVAQVAPHFGAFDSDGNLYSGGAGLRFVVEPKNSVTLRIDYAIGEDEDAFYVSVGEAF